MRLNEYSLVQLGQGKYQQRIRATMTSKTSALAVDIAGDKKMTNQLLAAAGLPVPRSEVVRAEDAAVAAANRIGFPVVAKPLDGNHGRGVALDLRTERAVRTGFRRAQKESRRGFVVVESFVTGNDYRVLVIGGRMVGDRRARAGPRHRRRQAHDPMARRQGEPGPAPRDRPREGAHADQGRRGRPRAREEAGATRSTTCRPKGERVLLAATGNMSTGGISIDRTWEAHEDNVEIAEEAARVVGLDVAGIDFLAPDIAQPVREARRRDRRGERGARVPDAHAPHRG